MSLKLWLPLNGDFHNQGLGGPLNFTTTGTITDQPGKIGQSKQFSSSNVIAPYNFTLGTEISACCWIYYTAFPSSSSNDWILDLASTSGYSSTPFGLSTYHSTKLVPIVGGKYDDTYAHNFSLNTWYHIAFTWNNTEGKLYINGELKKTYTTLNDGTVITGTKFSLGSNVANSTTKFKGRLNDVRIYDHCLSAKEVEEISKGLILHYKLNDGINQANWLLPNFEKIITRGTSNTFIDYEYYSDLIANTETSYTVDFYAKGSASDMKIDIYFRNSGGSAYAVTSQQTLTTNWEHYSLSLSGSPASLAIFRVRCWSGTANDIAYIRDMKLLSNNMPIRNNIIYDSSGYNNNGNIIGNLTIISSTPKYNYATYLKSSSPTTNNDTGLSYIQTSLQINTPTQMTICWWANPENGYNNSVGHAAWCTSADNDAPLDYNSTAFHHRDNKFDICLNSASTTSLSLAFNNYTKNEWHYYCVVYDGKDAILYKDGIETNRSSISSTIAPLKSFTNLYIGFSKAGGVWRKTLGSYSDFRMYITALTASQIKELYETSATIDNNGNIYTRELVEE